MSPCPFPTTITITPRAPPEGERLECELAHYDSAVHRYYHYTTRTPLPLPFQAVVDLEVMAIKKYTAISKVPEVLEPHHICLLLYPGHSLGESYTSVEIQSVYSATPATVARSLLE